MHISSIVVVFSVAFCSTMVTTQLISPNTTGIVYDIIPGDCSIPLNSPQFAVLCQVADVNLPVLNYLSLTNVTANYICEGDCRCVMGAPARGGSCATPVGKTQKYCVCDYGTDPTPSNVDCSLFPLVTSLCLPDALTNGFLEGACNADCICSHGYNATGNHHCSRTTGQCICENRTTLAVLS